MNKRLALICLLLVGAFFPLAAQTGQSVSVFLPLVVGTGIDERDSSFFYMFIYHELEARDYIRMGRSDFSTDFSLRSAISPQGTDRVTSLTEYRFDLYLQDNRTGQILSEQRYRYSSLENVDIALQMMLDNIFTLIKPVPPPVEPVQAPAEPAQAPVQAAPQPVEIIQQPVLPFQRPVQPVQQPVQPAPQPAEPVQQPVTQPVQQPVGPVQPVTPAYEGDWRDKWLFLSASAFWTPRLYVDGEGRQSFYLSNPGVGVYSEFRFLDSVSLETGFELTKDWIVIENDDETYQDMVLEVPVLVKFFLKPGANFLLEPYSGIYLNFPLLTITKPPLLSWVVGYQHGVKAGPGALFFDFRFSMDLGPSYLAAIPDLPYQRYRMSIGVGYKYGVLERK